MADLIDRLIHLRIRCGERTMNAFWISLRANGDVSVGSSDRKLRVSRIGPSGLGDDHQIVVNPHVTYHQPSWTHLTGNRGVALWEALTFGEPGPGEPPASWVEIVTSPIRMLRDGRGRNGQNAEVWPLDYPDDSKSACLLVDFARASHAQQNRSMQEKYIAWGRTVLRLRVATLDAREPSIQVFTWG
jgi:hypothetical protein